RGVLVVLVLTYPLCRLRGRFAAAVVVAGLVLALATSVWESGPATIAVALALIGAAVGSYLTAVGPGRRRRQATLGATVALAAIFAGAGVAHLWGSAAANSTTLLAYQLSLVLLAVALVATLIRAHWEPRGIDDLVVELGEARSSPVRDSLARALGDPTLQVGYWSPAVDAYVDARGRMVELPASTAGRTVTWIERSGAPVAVLVHDRAVLDDPELLEAVGTASSLAAANARLHAEIREQIAELEASRSRLLRASDQERSRLEQHL